jgi:hypothetical protein
MARDRSDHRKSYPRLHVEMRHLSEAVILVDGWLIENDKGRGRTVLRKVGSPEEIRLQIAQCAARYGAECNDDDVVMH